MATFPSFPYSSRRAFVVGWKLLQKGHSKSLKFDQLHRGVAIAADVISFRYWLNGFRGHLQLLVFCFSLFLLEFVYRVGDDLRIAEEIVVNDVTKFLLLTRVEGSRDISISSRPMRLMSSPGRQNRRSMCALASLKRDDEG